MILAEDVRPWMREPATEKQWSFIRAIERVTVMKCTPGATKLEAKVYIDSYAKLYYEKIAKEVKIERKRGSSNIPKTYCDSSMSRGCYSDEERKMDELAYKAKKEALASVGLGIGPWGEIYSLDEDGNTGLGGY